MKNGLNHGGAARTLFLAISFAAISLSASPVVAQQTPTSRQQAQQMIFFALEDATYTIYNSSPAATGWYKGVASNDCQTRYKLYQPPHTAGGVFRKSQIYSFGVNWAEVREVGPEPSNPQRIRVIRDRATEWFSIPVDRHATFIAAGRYLLQSCRPATTAAGTTPPVQQAKPQSTTPVALPAVPPSPVVIAEFLNFSSLPKNWIVSYGGMRNQVHVFVYAADLRANPVSAMLDGSTYLRRDVCRDPLLKAVLERQMRMSADTVYVDASGKRTVKAEELRCT